MVSMLDEAEEAVPGAAKAGGDEDWVETHSSTHPSASSAAGGAGLDGQPSEIPEIPDLEPYPSSSATELAPPAHSAIPDEPSLASLTLDDQSVHAVVGGDDEIPDLDDIPDMDDEDDSFGGGLMEEDDEATARPAAAAREDESNLLAVRTYDVMIT
jgi:ubiquitin-like-conjugating enzyme ATG3